MRCETSKRGSALLIVLGMLAFMVISAVAFSAYMRAARLPSSYLRRVVASRMLVKAALTEAIDEIDAAVGNFPHPGVWMDPSSVSSGRNRGQQTISGAATYLTRNTDHTDTDRNSNVWLGRVYIGNDSNLSKTKAQECMIPQYQTVPTLTLEALAYIPPPLVNEARYYSRHSNAGTWHTMGFDAGRYAFCAIDVSDYFDINALTAGYARNSSPSGRISLSYLFEPDDHGSAASQDANWDDFIGQCLNTKVPLISVADWNLAMSSPIGSMKSYFRNYVEGNGNNFYAGDAGSDSGIDQIARMAFVTDGWFPPDDGSTVAGNNNNQKRLDLSDPANQPFTQSDLESDNMSYYSVINYSSQKEPQDQLMQSIPGLGFCALFDYLDKNDTPLSLAIPTMERTPMICGISPGMAGGQFQVPPPQLNMEATWKGDPTPGGACHVVYKAKYEISGLPNAPIETLVAFPFRNKMPKENSYEIGGRLSMFLSDVNDPVKLRTENATDILHLNYQDKFTGLTGYELIDKAVMAVPLKGSCPQPSSFDNASGGEENAVKQVSLTPNGRFPQTVTFLDVTYEWDTVDTTPSDMPAPSTPVPQVAKPDLNQDGIQVTAATCDWAPLQANGTPSPDFVANLTQTLMDPSKAKDLKLNLAVWVWIKNSTTGKIVDLVPACVYDDADVNNLNTDNLSRKWGQDNLGLAYPLMRFDMSAGGAAMMTFKPADAGQDKVAAPTAAPMQVDPVTVYVGDPRFNHAPESWFADSGNLSPQSWLDKCGRQGSNDDHRDGDIFMQVSDQGYLQSIYELANLPRLSDFYQVGSTKTDRGWYVNPSSDRDAKFRTGAFSVGANSTMMWRTYNPFPGSYLGDGDDFENCGFSAAGNGFKVSPYTDSTNILMSALANTPSEWRTASPFNQDIGGEGDFWSSAGNKGGNGGGNQPAEASSFNSSYAWNQYSSKTKIHWNDLADFAGSFMDEIRKSPADDWRDIWSDLGWFRTFEGGEFPSQNLCGINLEDTTNPGRIWNTDKKFLYGFWRECFDVKQQLFLIFVRAEPMLMGGGAVGQTPPQLGGRAMALVWRDPVNRSTQTLSPGGSGAKGGNSSGYTTGGAAPHRTRILFYRQFD